MTRDEAIARVLSIVTGPQGDDGYPPAVMRDMLLRDPVAQAIKANPGLVVDAISQKQDTLRLIIGPVVVTGDVIEIREHSRIEASSWEEAAKIADANFPDSQIMIVRVGRIHNVACASELALGQAGGA